MQIIPGNQCTKTGRAARAAIFSLRRVGIKIIQRVARAYLYSVLSLEKEEERLRQRQRTTSGTLIQEGGVQRTYMYFSPKGPTNFVLSHITYLLPHFFIRFAYKKCCTKIFIYSFKSKSLLKVNIYVRHVLTYEMMHNTKEYVAGILSLHQVSAGT